MAKKEIIKLFEERSVPYGMTMRKSGISQLLMLSASL